MTQPLYPIRAVARLTGLPLDTLRAWERRYRAVEPTRGPRGRLYSESHVHRLRRLRELVERGHAIGQVAGLSDADLQKLLATDRGSIPARGGKSSQASEEMITSLVDSIERFDYAAADRELSRLAVLLAPRDLIYRVALPLMRRVGENWHQGTLSVAQEHMTSALLRNLLGGLLRLYSEGVPAARILFATPAGEHHDFGLLTAAMLAASRGIGVIYLGPNLPAEEIARAVRQVTPTAVLIGVSGTDEAERALREIDDLSTRIPLKTEFWLGGTVTEEQVAHLKGRSPVVLKTFEELEKQLRRLCGR